MNGTAKEHLVHTNVIASQVPRIQRITLQRAPYGRGEAGRQLRKDHQDRHAWLKTTEYYEEFSRARLYVQKADGSPADRSDSGRYIAAVYARSTATYTIEVQYSCLLTKILPP